MSGKLTVTEIATKGNTITIAYDIDGESLRNCFAMPGQCSYSYDFPVESMPRSIALVPFLMNIAPVIWVNDAELVLPCCDKELYESLPAIRQAYADMYPEMTWKGDIRATAIDDNENDGHAVMMLYSGGVDSTFSLISHIDEKPGLVMIHGSDIALDDTDGWNRLYGGVRSMAAANGIGCVSVAIPLRGMLNEPVLNAIVSDEAETWWYGIQHGIGIAGCAIPAAYASGCDTIYMASTYSASDTGIHCASHPSIDGKLLCGGTHIVHDGYEHNRQEKINAIVRWCDETGSRVSLHVCWASGGGTNCCSCEKCWGTMLGIYAAEGNPRDYGFELDFDSAMGTLHGHADEALERWSLRYGPALATMHARYAENQVLPSVLWFYQLDEQSMQETASWHVKSKREWEERYESLHDWMEELQASKDWLDAEYARLTAERSDDPQPNRNSLTGDGIWSRARGAVRQLAKRMPFGIS